MRGWYLPTSHRSRRMWIHYNSLRDSSQRSYRRFPALEVALNSYFDMTAAAAAAVCIWLGLNSYSDMTAVMHVCGFSYPIRNCTVSDTNPLGRSLALRLKYSLHSRPCHDHGRGEMRRTGRRPKSRPVPRTQQAKALAPAAGRVTSYTA